METVALVLECEAAFRKEGLPEVLLDPVLYAFAGDGDQRLGNYFWTQLPDQSAEGGKQTRKAALGEITFEGLQFPQRRFQNLTAAGKTFVRSQRCGFIREECQQLIFQFTAGNALHMSLHTQCHLKCG